MKPIFAVVALYHKLHRVVFLAGHFADTVSCPFLKFLRVAFRHNGRRELFTVLLLILQQKFSAKFLFYNATSSELWLLSSIIASLSPSRALALKIM